jgi:hypothetical protein
MVGSLILKEGSEFCLAWNINGTEMLVISILRHLSQGSRVVSKAILEHILNQTRPDGFEPSTN